tara:strand:+ start:156 stop:671 length:516 start_codon:yes stop_codon:yes gene_type:complete
MTEKLVKTKKRVADVGEVFTPRWLVDEIIETLPESLFENSRKTFIDPACGNGNFLVEVIAKKRQSGATALEALATTYGVDIMADNVVECRQRAFKAALQDDDLNYHGERNPFKRFIKKRMLYRMQRLVRQNIRHGDTLKFEMEDIFAAKPSEELVNFRNKKGEISELDSGA